MDRRVVENKLKEILRVIKPLEGIDFTQSLYSIHNGFESRDMFIVMMRIKEAYGIDLNDLLKDLGNYTFDSIARKVCFCLNKVK